MSDLSLPPVAIHVSNEINRADYWAGYFQAISDIKEHDQETVYAWLERMSRLSAPTMKGTQQNG